MFKFLKELLFNRIHTINELRKENEELKDKLQKRQEDINKTNAYWKKKLHNLTRNNS